MISLCCDPREQAVALEVLRSRFRLMWNRIGAKLLRSRFRLMWNRMGTEVLRSRF